MSMKRFYAFVLVIGLAVNGNSLALSQSETDTLLGNVENQETLGIEEYLMLAARNDAFFEEILIDELALQYRKDIGIAARDLVFSVKNNYEYFPRQERGDRETQIALSKLFPYIGTEVTASYKTAPSLASRQNSSAMTIAISQPIAENAFGRATRLRDKIIGVEIDVVLHQIAEAYEDYLATVITAYLTWYEAYENYKIGESSYRENLKLKENMEERMKSNIALPIDVNKITLQVLAKQETLISLRTRYQNAVNFIVDSIAYEGDKKLVPVKPDLYAGLSIDFESNYARFHEESRTAQILGLLEIKSDLSVKEEFDDLLPSIAVQAGSTWDWTGQQAEREDHLIFAGVTMSWSIFEQVDRAEYNTAKIDRDKTRLTTGNILDGLYVDLLNLYQQVSRERELAAIAAEKIESARSVLDAETENYSFGKVTLNDYIDAVNVYDNNRFNRVLRDVSAQKLIVEWLRLSDQLISRREIQERHT